MYLRSHLGFLPGFPLGVEQGGVRWLPSIECGARSPSTTVISAETLRRAMFGWNKLTRHFPKALPKAVEDTEAWRRSVPRLLETLGAAVHSGNALPPSLFSTRFRYSPQSIDRAAAIARLHPKLRSLLNALSWTDSLNPAASTAKLAWLEGNVRYVEALLYNLEGSKGLATAFLLADLAIEHGSKRIEPLSAILGCTDGPNVPTSEGKESVDAWIRLAGQAAGKRRQWEENWPKSAEPHWYATVLRFLESLCGLPSKSQRLALDMFGMVFPGDLLERWRIWWENVHQTTQRLRRQIVSHGDVDETHAILIRLRAAVSNRPHEVKERHSSRGSLTAMIDRLARPELKNVRLPLLRILKDLALENTWGLPRASLLAMVEHWLRCWDAPEIARVLRSLKLASIPAKRLAGLFAEIDLWDLLEPPTEPLRACRALGFWINELHQGKNFEWPLAISRATADTKRLKACLRQLADTPDGTRLDDDALDAALRFAADGDLLKAATAAQQAHERDYAFWKRATPVCEQLQQAGWSGLVEEVMFEGELRDLQSLAGQSELARCVEASLPPDRCPADRQPPAWARSYPTELHESLARLAAIAADAQPTAERLLSTDFPDSESLAREIASLEARLAASDSGTNLARRLENLRRRAAAPRPLSKQRIKNLRTRIHRATRKHVFDQWQKALRDRTDERLRELLGMADLPPWISEERHQRSLGAVLRLPGWAKPLGLQLFRLRCGSPPWHLRRERANVRFLARLDALGVDAGPWLEPLEASAKVGADGSRVRVAFEDDPLEIFQMGGYFKTCLSPGQCNFFSTVANAADVNKRVLFARGDNGQVVGRCLLTIADNGAILAFHPYCHNARLGFDAIVAEILRDLAARMKTIVVQRGTVQPLVAKEWYDDGPVNLVDTLPCMREGSELRRDLQTVKLSEFVSSLERAFDPLALNGITLPMLLGLSELDMRPELVLPLLPRIERDASLPPTVMARAAWLAHRAVASSEAKRIIQSRVMPEVNCIMPYDIATLGAIVEIDPSSGIRALRATRPCALRKDDDESDDRRKLLAEAYRLLGRESKAATYLAGRTCRTSGRHRD
jgi:hypothetical protein